MEYKSSPTKDLLAAKTKELILIKDFNKITIKMITDRAGVIRPTFYNYFKDKYEILEYLVELDFKDAHQLIETGMVIESFKMLFMKIANDMPFYQKAFKITDFIPFESIYRRQLNEMIKETIKRYGIRQSALELNIDTRILADYLSNVVLSFILYYMEHPADLDIERTYQIFVHVITNPIQNILNIELKRA